MKAGTLVVATTLALAVLGLGSAPAQARAGCVHYTDHNVPGNLCVTDTGWGRLSVDTVWQATTPISVHTKLIRDGHINPMTVYLDKVDTGGVLHGRIASGTGDFYTLSELEIGSRWRGCATDDHGHSACTDWATLG